MPDRLEVQDVTCQPGVSAAAPTETVLSGLVNCQLVRVTIRIPPGHAGLTGIALGYGHQAVFPRTVGRYISGDDEVLTYDLTDYVAGPQWQAFTINADTIAHNWELRAEVNELTDLAPPSAPAFIPEGEIYNPGSGTIVGVG